VIDLHAHVVLEATLGAAGALGPELLDGDGGAGDGSDGRRSAPCFRVGGYRLEGVRYRGTPFMDVDVRLRAMDRHGITFQVLSPNPLTYLPHVEVPTAVAFARRHNDALAAVVAEHPDRLGGLAQLPVQDPGEAAEELQRAVRDLGLLGASIPADPGRPLDDPALDVLYATCTALDVPLFVHPAPDGIDRPRRDERLVRFDADLWLGFAYEEALAVATIVLGGVLDRHRGLDLCVSHGGGATAWLAERLDHAAETRAWADAALAEPGAVLDRLRRLWWDTHVGGPRAFTALVAAFGTDRLVGGTNFAGWDAHHDPAPGRPDLAPVIDGNARRLLRLPA
jgi:aminocarboxymuconate-semialdehyde decarboxylase